MRFDLFYELSVPASGGRSEAEVYHQTLDELVLAETLGFSTAWLVEHHFMPGYSHSTAPELFLAAATQRTRHLRLGHAIVPLPYHHPVHVAERLATLDVLSHGRVEFGFGRGFSPKEYASFGANMGDSRDITREAFEIIRATFVGAPFSHHGQHFQLDAVTILPRVIQSPHPPLWTAAVSPDSFELAAELGVGALVGPFKPWFMVREDIRHYRQAWQRHHGHAGAQAGQNPRVGMTVGLFCLEDGHEARRLARDGITWFYRHLLGQTRPILEKLYESYEYYRKVGRLSGLMEKTITLRILETLGMVIVGDPAHCTRKLRALQQAGVDHVLCAIGAGVLPSTLVQRCLRVLAHEVMPAFAEKR